MSPGRVRGRRPIDWAAVKSRLAAAAAASDAALQLSPERASAVLDERARALAQVPPAAPAPDEVLGTVTFALAGERYAIETRYVREVVCLQDFTTVPGVPEFVLGLTNLRGEVLAIMDLRRLIGADGRRLADLARVIVLGTDRPELGVLADSVDGFALLRTEALLPPPEARAGAARLHLRGVTEDALAVLDGAALLADPRLTIEQNEHA